MGYACKCLLLPLKGATDYNDNTDGGVMVWEVGCDRISHDGTSPADVFVSLTSTLTPLQPGSPPSVGERGLFLLLQAQQLPRHPEGQLARPPHRQEQETVLGSLRGRPVWQ
jgi:hypothetical protein